MISTENQTNLQLLQDLVALDIPETPPRELGFLDVVNHTTRETTICNVYRYFLDRELSPKLSRLMLDSLLELIQAAYGEKIEKTLELSDYLVLLEQSTPKGRLDIVLESKADETVIIIEVKIYHWLHNDLEDYWNNYDYDDPKKAGVILSLDPMSEEQIANPNFVSITHAEWLNKVCNQLPHDLPVKDFIYFKDFANNMNHLTHSTEMTEEVEFYLKHAEKINKAIETKDTAHKYVIDQLRDAAGKLNFILEGTAYTWRHIWDESSKSTLYYTVNPEAIIDGKNEIKIILEAYNCALPYEEDLKTRIHPTMQKGDHGNKNFQHIGYKTYSYSIEEFENLAETISTIIKKEFEPTRSEMIEFLKTKNAATHQ